MGRFPHYLKTKAFIVVQFLHKQTNTTIAMFMYVYTKSYMNCFVHVGNFYIIFSSFKKVYFIRMAASNVKVDAVLQLIVQKDE